MPFKHALIRNYLCQRYQDSTVFVRIYWQFRWNGTCVWQLEFSVFLECLRKNRCVSEKIWINECLEVYIRRVMLTWLAKTWLSEFLKTICFFCLAHLSCKLSSDLKKFQGLTLWLLKTIWYFHLIFLINHLILVTFIQTS